MPTLTKRARGTEATQSQASEADCFGAVRIETVTAEIRTTARLGYHESKSGRIDLGVALRVANQIESHSSVIGQISNPGSRFSATSYVRSKSLDGGRPGTPRMTPGSPALPSLLLLVLVVGPIVARCAVVIAGRFRAVGTPIIPSPAMAVLSVYVAISVTESPCVVLLNPLALASLIPVVLVGSNRARCQNKRTDQNRNHC
jgi:hypothetical protein